MTIFRRGATRSGHWAFDFWHQGVRYTRSGFPSRATAKQAQEIQRARLVDQRLARDYGIGLPRGRIPLVRTFFDAEYLPEMRATRAHSTVIAVRSALRPFVAAHGTYRLTDVTTRHLEAYRDLRLKTIGANSLRRELDWVGHLFTMAIARGYLTASPRRGLRLPREDAWPDRILTGPEQQTLLTAVESPQYRDVIHLAILTGLRRQEVCGIRTDHVRLETAQLSVPMRKVGAIKLLPLSPEALGILQRHLSTAGYVFHSRTGKAIHGSELGRVFRDAVRRAGLPPLRFHDLRHTFAVRLLEAGWDIPTVGELLGHKPPYHTTLRYIAHTRQARLREAVSGQHPQPFPHRTPDTPLEKSTH